MTCSDGHEAKRHTGLDRRLSSWHCHSAVSGRPDGRTDRAGDRARRSPSGRRLPRGYRPRGIELSRTQSSAQRRRHEQHSRPRRHSEAPASVRQRSRLAAARGSASWLVWSQSSSTVAIYRHARSRSLARRRLLLSRVEREAARTSSGRFVAVAGRPIRQRGSSRPRCCRSGRARACAPASVRQAGDLNVTVPRSRSGTVATSAARSSGIRPERQRRR